MHKFPMLLMALLFAVSLPAEAKLRAFACEPEWGALLDELAGDTIRVDVATTALQDVHVVEARPSLIARMRNADLLELFPRVPAGCAVHIGEAACPDWSSATLIQGFAD